MPSPEDQSFTHTLIEMFMVEANEAVARLLDSHDVPFLRRTHPEPEADSGAELQAFRGGRRIQAAQDCWTARRFSICWPAVKGKPQSFAINLAVLKSLTRAEYSPRPIGHYALASEHYCHFTSPIRRYADLTIHRLLEQYISSADRLHPAVAGVAVAGIGSMVHRPKGSWWNLASTSASPSGGPTMPSANLRQVKILELLSQHVGEDFPGVITGITNFGIFVQIHDLADRRADPLRRPAGRLVGRGRAGRRHPRAAQRAANPHRRYGDGEGCQGRSRPAGTGVGDYSAGESK